MDSDLDNSKSQTGFLIKTIIVGDSNVGKSSILRRFVYKEFANNYSQTIGIEFESKEIKIKGSNDQITLQIWDTAGQESFHSIVKQFFRNSAAVMLVYDVTRRETFTRLQYWINQIRSNSHDNVIIILIGNKKDSKLETAQVSDEEIRDFITSQRLSMHFYTSALIDQNINESFQYVGQEVYDQFIKVESNKNGVDRGIRLSLHSKQNPDRVRISQNEVDQQKPSQQQNNLSIRNNNNNKTPLIQNEEVQAINKTNKCSC